jgi:hypothetical protein
MYLPSKYAPLLLSNKGYEVKDAYEILLAAFQADNIVPDAGPILFLAPNIYACYESKQ